MSEKYVKMAPEESRRATHALRRICSPLLCSRCIDSLRTHSPAHTNIWSRRILHPAAVAIVGVSYTRSAGK